MIDQIEHTTIAPAQTEALGALLAAILRPGDCVALTGELGAGKTCFVRGVARGMGHDPGLVSSPTFVLMHEYVRDDPGVIPLVHVDAYRITGPDDLETLALDQAVADAVLIVEWAERIEDALPPGRLRVTFEHAGDPEAPRRIVRFDASGPWRARLAPLRADTIP